MHTAYRLQCPNQNVLNMAIMLVICLFGLSSCGTLKAGAGFGGAKANDKSALYINALQGGVVSKTGASLSKGQMQRALETEYRALEAGEGGQSIPWEEGSASGTVIAASPYQVGTQNCRQLSHSILVNGKTYQARGAACRNEDGTWSPLE